MKVFKKRLEGFEYQLRNKKGLDKIKITNEEYALLQASNEPMTIWVNEYIDAEEEVFAELRIEEERAFIDTIKNKEERKDIENRINDLIEKQIEENFNNGFLEVELEGVQEDEFGYASAIVDEDRLEEVRRQIKYLKEIKGRK